MPAYLSPEHTWSHYQGWLDTLHPAPADHPVHAGLAAGQVTDDTEQAMALAQTIIEHGQVTLAGAAQAIVTWYDQIDGDNTPYVGPSTRRAVAALKAGQDPRTTGQRGDTNGGAMRISPVGLIHPGDPDAAIEDAIIACTPTHFAGQGLAGACAVAAAVAQASAADATLESIIAAALHGADVGQRRGAPWLGASVARKIELAVKFATEGNLSERERLQNLYDLIGSTLAAADSVPCAFGVLVMADGHPVYAAIYAAALSGDADTVAAIACAIAGAWQGVEVIPADHLETIRQANPQYDFEQTAAGLCEIALRNYQAHPPTDENSFLDSTLLDDIRNQKS